MVTEGKFKIWMAKYMVKESIKAIKDQLYPENSEQNNENTAAPDAGPSTVTISEPENKQGPSSNHEG